MTVEEVLSFKKRLISQIITSAATEKDSGSSASNIGSLSGSHATRKDGGAEEAMLCYLEEKCQFHKRRRCVAEAELKQAMTEADELKELFEHERTESKKSLRSLIDALIILEQNLWSAEKAREEAKDEIYAFLHRTRALMEHQESQESAISPLLASSCGAKSPPPHAAPTHQARGGSYFDVRRSTVTRSGRDTVSNVVQSRRSTMTPGLMNSLSAEPVDSTPDQSFLRMLEERRRTRRDKEMEMKDELINALKIRWNEERGELERELKEERQRRTEAEERAERLKRELEEERRNNAGRTWETARKERKLRKARSTATKGANRDGLAEDSHFVKIISMAIYNMRFENAGGRELLSAANCSKERKKDKSSSIEGRASILFPVRRDKSGDEGESGSTIVTTINPLMTITSGAQLSPGNLPMLRRGSVISGGSSGSSTSYSQPYPSEAKRYENILPSIKSARRGTVSPSSLFTPTGPWASTPAFASFLSPPASSPSLSSSASIPVISSTSALLSATLLSPRRGPFGSNIHSTQITVQPTTEITPAQTAGSDSTVATVIRRSTNGPLKAPAVAIPTSSGSVQTVPITSPRTSGDTEDRGTMSDTTQTSPSLAEGGGSVRTSADSGGHAQIEEKLTEQEPVRIEEPFSVTVSPSQEPTAARDS